MGGKNVSYIPLFLTRIPGPANASRWEIFDGCAGCSIVSAALPEIDRREIVVRRRAGRAASAMDVELQFPKQSGGHPGARLVEVGRLGRIRLHVVKIRSVFSTIPLRSSASIKAPRGWSVGNGRTGRSALAIVIQQLERLARLWVASLKVQVPLADDRGMVANFPRKPGDGGPILGD